MSTACTKQKVDETERDPRWIALKNRNPGTDDFFYAVKTTGVYCRPSCPARLPRPVNVLFFTTCDEAEHAGFRPCKRCKPTQSRLEKRHAALMQSACRMIEASETTPSLNELAARHGFSAYHFQRLFKRCIGVTPKAYAMAQREKRLRTLLAKDGSVTDAIFNAGYQSSSRFYERAAHTVGMPPSAYRSGGLNMPIRFAVGESTLGSILVAQSTQGLCAILLGDNPEELLQDLQARFPRAELIGADKDFEQLVAYVVGFVQAPGENFDLPLDIRGTAFQQQVWNALRRIPPGQTLSYTELAKAIGMPKAVRAVAAACAANPLAVAIPCHRVVRSDGKLAGYRWKIERKRSLLDTEASLALAQPVCSESPNAEASGKKD